jgi:tetratricopeptide (TPR) repeat protein
VTGVLIAERLLFLPSVGFVLALGGGFVAVREIANRRFGSAAATELRKTGTLVLAVAVLAGVVRSIERERVWRNDLFISVRGVQDSPRSYRMQRAYGDVLFELGQRERAFEAYERAFELAPPDHVWRVRNALAKWYRVLGDTESEVRQLHLSLAERSDQEHTRGFLVAALLALGRYSEARAQADTAIALGGNRAAFESARALADSARRAGAPPGTIRPGVRTAPQP